MNELIPGLVPDTPNNRFALGLLSTAGEHSPWLTGHSLVVADLGSRIASELGMSAEERDLVFTAGMLHDIGKARLPKAIVEKGSALTEDERRLFEKHPEWGEELWRGLQQDLIAQEQRFANDPDWAEARRHMVEGGDDGQIASIVRHHHERWDGTGYPDRLHQDPIPLGARIVAVADAYAHLKSPGVGSRDPFAPLTPLAISGEAGEAFDPEVVRAAEQVWGA